MDYKISIPHNSITLFHVNLLKAWQEVEEETNFVSEPNWDEEGCITMEILHKQQEGGGSPFRPGRPNRSIGL